jgi:hypothetical protein
VFAGYEEYSRSELLECEELIKLLLTHSTIVSAVNERKTSLEDAVEWLRAELGQFFVIENTLPFPFGGHIYYLLHS